MIAGIEQLLQKHELDRNKNKVVLEIETKEQGSSNFNRNTNYIEIRTKLF